MNEKVQKAFDFAADVIKQLITLATGIIAVTITFSKDIIGASMITNSLLIYFSWGLFLISIMSGIWGLLALTGNLRPMNPPPRNTVPSINSKNVRIPMFMQIGTFLLALLLTVSFGISSMKNANSTDLEKTKKKKEKKHIPSKKNDTPPLRKVSRL